jgi:hypothetical protein
MAGFTFRLEYADGTAADPPTFSAAVPDWETGHTVHFGARTLRVIGKRDDDADQPPVLIIEERDQDVSVSAVSPGESN